MWRTVLFVISLLAFSVSGADAQKKERQRNYSVAGRVVDAFTGDPIGKAVVDVFNADSLLVASDTTKFDDAQENNPFLMFQNGRFNTMLHQLGKYHARISKEGYEPKTVNFQLKYKNEEYINLEEILLSKDVFTLDEVNVTATKIKMVLRGDTVVYNADAFHLAEGSMLDALIRKLPGTELKDNGQIYVNGRYVNSLLVNGKEFFTGNPQLALQNLPAYIVNKVKVYERKGLQTELMGRDMHDETYVMDVNLKKEYSSGWILGSDIAYGTSQRYTVRGSAIHFNDLKRMMIYAGVNNLGQNAMYDSQSSSWHNTGMPTADATYYNGGFAFQYQPSTNMRSSRFITTNDLSYSTVDSKNWTSTQSFLQGGDLYGRTFSLNETKTLALSTNNIISFNLGKSNFHVSANGNYSKNDNNVTSLNASFNANPEDFKSLEDDVFGTDGNRFEQITINRSKNISESARNNTNLSVRASGFINVMGNMVETMISGGYEKLSGSSFELNNYEYRQTGTTDHRNNYTSTPSHNVNMYARLGHSHRLKNNNSIRLAYMFSQRHNKTDNWLYRLDRLGDEATRPYNVLPSTAQALNSVVDAPNSYTFDEYQTSNQIELGFFGIISKKPKDLTKMNSMASYSYNIRLPLELKNNSLNYFRQKDYSIRQNRLSFSPAFDFECSKAVQHTRLSVQLNNTQPTMTDLITITDDSNPLYIRKGNADLKDTRTLTLSAMHNISMGCYFDIGYNRIYNAIATENIIDKTTGITTAMPVNIDGNWDANVSANYTFNLDKKKRLQMTTNLSARYMESVDLNTVMGSLNNEKSTVGNSRLTGKVALDWDINEKVSLNAFATDAFTHQSSKREGFTTVNAHNIMYGGELLAELPYNFQFITSVEQASRRGYSDKRMNDDELIWNARLQRSFFGGKLLTSLEGYDLLSQRTNRRYVVNVQGRTESYSNLIPSFVLLRLTYRLTKMPKKKGTTLNSMSLPVFHLGKKPKESIKTSNQIQM